MIFELPKILSAIYKTTTFIATTDAMFSLYTRYMDTSKEELIQKDNDIRLLVNEIIGQKDEIRRKDEIIRQKDEIIDKFIIKNHSHSSWFFWR